MDIESIVPTAVFAWVVTMAALSQLFHQYKSHPTRKEFLEVAVHCHEWRGNHPFTGLLASPTVQKERI